MDVAGSYRRRREIVRDVDLVVATKKPAAITEFFVKHALVESIIARGPTKTSVRLRPGIQCDLRVVSSAEYPFALNYFTGSKEHNIEMRSRALKRGWTLNEYRLAKLPMAAVLRAVTLGETRGFVKVLIDAQSDRILGFTAFGVEASEMMAAVQTAMLGGLPYTVLRDAIFTHPTAAEGLVFLLASVPAKAMQHSA